MTSNAGSSMLLISFFALCILGPVVYAKPRRCLDKFEVYRNHTMCLSDLSRKLNHTEREEIQNAHNNIREKVIPTATRMLEMEYGLPLEYEAQTWADSCALEHDDPNLRFMPGRYTVGQNIYIGADLNWTTVIDIWASENSTFTYNKTGNDKTKVGNYTQIVNAETTSIGCGKQACGNDYFYVCNYSPGMIDTQIDRPYEAGNTGADCQNKFSNDTRSLCSCIGKTCINAGKLDLKTCSCQCEPGVKGYDDYVCELTCIKDGDHNDCKNMQESDCRTNSTVPFRCPWLCKVCPYSGKGYSQGSVRMPWETTTTSTTTSGPTADNSPSGPQQQKGSAPMPWETTTTSTTTSGPTADNSPSGPQQQKGSAPMIQAPTFLTGFLYLASVVFLLM